MVRVRVLQGDHGGLLLVGSVELHSEAYRYGPIATVPESYARGIVHCRQKQSTEVMVKNKSVSLVKWTALLHW